MTINFIKGKGKVMFHKRVCVGGAHISLLSRMMEVVVTALRL